jgi:hypothetical protein
VGKLASSIFKILHKFLIDFMLEEKQPPGGQKWKYKRRKSY